jgi:histone acetyltransferase
VSCATSAATTAIKEEEDRKEEPKPQTATFEFRVVANDNIRQHMFYLVDLKNIFSRQLPKMPREYISRLVFDKYYLLRPPQNLPAGMLCKEFTSFFFLRRNHRSLVCLRDGKVIGGICFRPFPENGFLEIAFLAVSVDFQIRVRTHHHTLFFFYFYFIFVF